MSDSLVVSGGGSTAVATDELFEHAQALELLRDGLAECRRKFVSWPLTDESDARVTQCVSWAAAAVDEAHRECDGLAAGLRRASERYGILERSLTRVQRDLGAEAAYVAGMLLPGLVALYGPAMVLGLLAAIAVGRAAGDGHATTGPSRAAPGGERGDRIAPGMASPGLDDWLRSHPHVTNNPWLAGLVRTAVSSVDDVGMGVAHFPPAARGVLGEGGFGILGVPEVGGVLAAGAAGMGLLRDSHVRVSRVESVAGTAASASGGVPRGFGELAARVPATSDGAQVRIERYGTSGGAPRYLVYVGGMVDPSPRARTEPWDVTSGARTVLGQESAAVRAVERAMTQAGIGARDPVFLTGYSLGGVVAREVGERGSFAVTGVVTFGAPVGQAAAPEGMRVVTVEHTEDVLAALGGHPPPSGTVDDPLVVRRSVIAELGPASDTLFAAHALEDYRRTAVLMDASGEARIADSRAELARFLDGTTAESVSHWRAERVPAEPAAGTAGGGVGGVGGVGAGGAGGATGAGDGPGVSRGSGR